MGTELSDRLFKRLAALVYGRSGINLHAGKKQLMRSRLAKRLRAVGAHSFEEYYEYLTTADDGSEMIQMVNAITTNKTSFFRESDQFDFLSGAVYPSLAAASKTGVTVRFWSAGCSTGEEPYSLAISILEYFGQTRNLEAKVLATDISTEVLEFAARGIYHSGKLAGIPEPLLKRSFQRGVGQHEGYFRVKDEVRKLVSFRTQNLIKPFQFGAVLDAIFCCNVMIYFDKETQQDVIRRFYDCIAPGGYLFVGHSESLAGIDHDFTYVKPTIYRKERLP